MPQVDQNLLLRLAQIVQGVQGAAVPTRQPGTPLSPGIGLNQAAPPNVAQAPPGVPLPGQQVGGAPATSTTGSVAAGTPIQTPERQWTPREYTPMPAPRQSGVAFPDAKAAKTAAVHDFVTHVTGIVNSIKQEKHQKAERQAKILFDELKDSRARGDTERIARLFDPTTPEGKRNRQIMEKSGLDVIPEVSAKPQKPPTPEQTAFQKSIAEMAKPSQQDAAASALALKQTQVQSTQADIGQLGASQVLTDASAQTPGGEALRREIGKGSMLSAEEQLAKQRADAGQMLTPKEQLLWGAERQAAAMDWAVKTLEINKGFEGITNKIASDEKIAALREASAGQGAALLAEIQLAGNAAQKAYYEYQAKRFDAVVSGSADRTFQNMVSLHKSYVDAVKTMSDKLAELRAKGDDVDVAGATELEKELRDMQIRLQTSQDNMDAIQAAKIGAAIGLTMQ
jgi:hypothetical protein